MQSDLRPATLEQLLSHTSGIPSDKDEHERLIQQSFTQEKLNLDELRYWIIKQLVTQPLQSKPGERFAYANMGYMLAGAMLERVTRQTWEELIVERVFEPLQLKSAGLGPQSRLGRVDAPLGTNRERVLTQSRSLLVQTATTPRSWVLPVRRTCQCSTLPGGRGGTQRKAAVLPLP